MKYLKSFESLDFSSFSAAIRDGHLNENQIEQFKNDREFISDVLLDWNDKGGYSEVEIHYDAECYSEDGKYIDISVSSLMPKVGIYHKNYNPLNFNTHPSLYFKFSDVKDEILSIKSYLGDRWYKCCVMFEDNFYLKKKWRSPLRIEVNIDENNYDKLDEYFQARICYVFIFFQLDGYDGKWPFKI